MEKTVIGFSIKKLAKARGLSVKDIAYATPLAYPTVEKYFTTGNVGDFKVKDLINLAEYLCVPVDAILDGSYKVDVYDGDEFSIMTHFPYNFIGDVLEHCKKYGFVEQKINEYDVYIPSFLKIFGDDLTERTKRVVELKYKNGLTYELIGKEVGLCKERIRQIINKAITIMSSGRRRSRYIITPPDEVEILKAQIDHKGNEVGYLRSLIGLEKEEYRDTIDMLDISVRSFNCLHRAGVDYIDDLKEYDVLKLLGIRNLGIKSVLEVIQKAYKYGVKIVNDTNDKRVTDYLNREGYKEVCESYGEDQDDIKKVEYCNNRGNTLYLFYPS